MTTGDGGGGRQAPEQNAHPVFPPGPLGSSVTSEPPAVLKQVKRAASLAGSVPGNVACGGPGPAVTMEVPPGHKLAS